MTMTVYGEVGGSITTPEPDLSDKFAAAVESALGDRMRGDADICGQLWCALANTTWIHNNGDVASYSFRAAGDLIAAIRGAGNYMDWYCWGPYPVVSDVTRAAMEHTGWRPMNEEESREFDAARGFGG